MLSSGVLLPEVLLEPPSPSGSRLRPAPISWQVTPCKEKQSQNASPTTSVRQGVLVGTGYVLYAPPCLFIGELTNRL